MNYCKRLLSLLFVFVLLFAVFSTPLNVSAAEPRIVLNHIIYDSNNKYKLTGFGSIDDNTVHDIVSSGTNYISIEDKPTLKNMENGRGFRMVITKADDGVIAKNGETWSLTLNSVLASFKWGSSASSLNTVNCKSFDNIYFTLVHTDNSSESITLTADEFTYSSGTNTHFISTKEYTATNDIRTIIIDYVYNPKNHNNLTGNKYFAWKWSLDPFSMDVDVQSDEEGLLSGILGWIKNIFSSITDGFADVSSWLANGFRDTVNSIKNVVSGITELPSKLWNLISEGIKGLFVPDSEYMTEYSDKWDTLLSSRFGAIYQVGSILTDFANEIKFADNTNTISFPTVSLNSVGIPFTFGGYDVIIVPERFKFLADICKLITSVVCTFLFINGLRNKYDEVMGVNQS